MPPGAQLDESLIAFLEGGRSIAVASCGPDMLAVVGKAVGCRVSRERGEVSILLERTSCDEFLGAVEAGGPVAATFTEPATHRSIQLKAQSGVIRPVGREVPELVDRYVTLFRRDLEAIGYGEAFTGALLAHDPADLVEVAFVPAEAFDQTPGPRAGGALT